MSRAQKKGAISCLVRGTPSPFALVEIRCLRRGLSDEDLGGGETEVLPVGAHLHCSSDDGFPP